MLRLLSLAEYHTTTTRRALSFAEQSFTVISLLLYSGGPLFLILSNGYSEGERISLDFPSIRFLFFFNYLICILLVAPRFRKIALLVSKNKLLLLLIGLICASVFWSTDPSMTLRRSLALIGTTFFGIYLGAAYSLKQQIKLLSWTFGIVIVLSFLFIIVIPQFGIMGGYHTGAWRGIYTHKNVLGKMMVLSTAIFLVISMGNKKQLLSWVAVALSMILLVRSTSASSLINLVVIVFVFFASSVFRLRFRIREIIISLFLVFLLITSIFAVQVVPDILAAMGKNLSFSGRTTLWQSVLELIGQSSSRILLGYGYGASWNSWEDATSYVWKAEYWDPPNSHNGFLDICLDLGILGLVVFFLGFCVNLAKSINMICCSRTTDALWPLMFITYLVLANLTETSLLLQNSIFWILYIAVSLTLVQPLKGE